jgi:tRNA threonylcarbamoyladenosine biosynthesis protein TsaB
VLVLAIETATEICSIAFAKNEQLIAECRLNVHRVHSEKLVPLIGQLSQDAQIDLNDLELIAISSGPGSFTGLRIGMAAAKGLAFALECPLISVITLDACAVQAPVQAGIVCPLIKARPDEVYAALYEVKADEKFPVRITEYQMLNIHELTHFMPAGTTILGNGVLAFKETLQKILGEKAVFVADYYSQPGAMATALLGTEKYRQNPVNELMTLEPFYIQDFQVNKSAKSI